MTDDPIYEGSNGRYYTDWQVDRKLTNGAWTPCLHETETGRRLVGIDDGELLLLVPTEANALPTCVELRSDGATAWIVDSRRAIP